MTFSQQRTRTRQPFGRAGILLTVSLIATLFVSSPVQAQKQQPDNCKWKSTAIEFNNGEAITGPEFYDLVCSFDAPVKKEKTVTVRGFLVAAKFERGQDHDIHAQIAASKEWEQDQLIIEVPAGGRFLSGGALTGEYSQN